MRDELHYNPDLPEARGRFWRSVLAEKRYGAFRAALADSDGTVVATRSPVQLRSPT